MLGVLSDECGLLCNMDAIPMRGPFVDMLSRSQRSCQRKDKMPSFVHRTEHLSEALE